MNSSERPARRLHTDRLLGLGLAVTTGIGLLHLYFGEWRDGPGLGGWVVPLVAYLGIFIAAVSLLCSRHSGPGADRHRPRKVLLPVIVTALCAALYFQAVIEVGLVMATLVATAAAIFALSAERQTVWSRVLVISVLAALGFWLIFGWLAPIIVDDALIF